MAVELNLPDLPEVSISVGAPPGPRGGRPPPRLPLLLRLREVLSAYLPLVLMLLLALATWWLVKNTPVPEPPRPDRGARTEPDYAMEQFALERFDAGGRLELRIEGARLRHLPASDRIEIEGASIRSISPEGRVTVATAARALGNGDGSEVQLLGGAEVRSTDADGGPIVMKSEFLHAFLVTEQVRTDRPVTVQTVGAEMAAAGLEYDHGQRKLELKGPMRAVMQPRAEPRRSGG